MFENIFLRITISKKCKNYATYLLILSRHNILVLKISLGNREEEYTALANMAIYRI